MDDDGWADALARFDDLAAAPVGKGNDLPEQLGHAHFPPNAVQYLEQLYTPPRGWGNRRLSHAFRRRGLPLASPAAEANAVRWNPKGACGRMFTPFALEEWQSRYEQEVEFNLADSGVHPVRLKELVDDPDKLERLLATPLHYPPVGGSDGLRRRIADLYPAAGAENVLVTVGASEANTLAIHALIEPGDHAVVLEPGYRQAWGTLRNLGARVDAFHLREENDWRPDMAELAKTIRPDTRLCCINNPNNPVGTIFDAAELQQVVEACRRVGAWLLVDEVYRGTERVRQDETETAWGSYERVLCTGSLSKAYGLPGLRVGWLVAPKELVETAWRHHEYFAISTGVLAMQIAELALAEPTRQRLIDRTRGYIRQGWQHLSEWADANRELVSVHPPDATALAFVRYRLDLPSEVVADRLRTEAGVLVGPGSTFGVEQHLRITHGFEPEYLDVALSRISDTLRGMQRA